MAPKHRPPLTEAELRIMRVLWTRGEATVSDVVDALKPAHLARNTVMTMLSILGRKDYVKHRTEGRTFVYRPTIQREAVQKGAIEHMLARFFDGSPEQLMVRLIDSERVPKEEAEKIRALLARGEANDG